MNESIEFSNNILVYFDVLATINTSFHKYYKTKAYILPFMYNYLQIEFIIACP